MQLANKRRVVTNNEGVVVAGRILMIEIDITVVDGASESNSDGFIDIYDAPPIDTWFYIEDTYNGKVLYAWIPNRFVELVEDGIAVNVVDMLCWQDNYIEDRYVETPSPRPSHLTPYVKPFPTVYKGVSIGQWGLLAIFVIVLLIAIINNILQFF